MVGRRSRVETIVMAMGAVRWSADGGYVGLAQRNPTMLSVEHGVVQVVAGGGGAVGGRAGAGDRPKQPSKYQAAYGRFSFASRRSCAN